MYFGENEIIRICNSHVSVSLPVSSWIREVYNRTKHYIGDEDYELSSFTRGMAGKLNFTPLLPFDPLCEPSSLSQWWKSWIKRFETYIFTMKITDSNQKHVLLLHQAGEATQENLRLITECWRLTAKQWLEDYFTPRKNVDFQVFQLRQTAHFQDKMIYQFVTRLRN